MPMADAGRLTDAQREVYNKIIAGKRGKIVGPLRVALHSPELANRWQALGEFLRFDTGLAPQISELAIICTGRYWNCQLEWFIHAGIAKEAGIASDIIESIRIAQAPHFDDTVQRSVYEFSRELLEFGQVNDSVYQNVLAALGVVALVELTALIGYYSMVAMTLNAHDVPLPEGATGLPTDLPQGSTLVRPTGLPPGRA
jgi:4-carboxymuconolactone decarboxylase